MKYFLPAAFLLALPIAYLLSLTQSPLVYTNQVTFKNGPTVNVTLAQTSLEKSRGLMGVTSLPKNSGMLFIFNEESQRSFWMLNTKIPLDMIFIGSDKRVTETITAQPCKATEPGKCELYSGSAKWVLEVNKGFVQQNGIKKGGLVDLDL